MSSFPEELSLPVYRSFNPDLGSFADANLIAHYDAFGKHEGRISSIIHSRQSFLDLLKLKRSFLEIGVFDNPSLEFLREKGGVVDYADWLGQEELIERAKSIEGRDHARVPVIRWILSNGYSHISERYDAVVSHHCVEHQPDLVNHFLDVKSILNQDGWYFFSLPDKRWCFDHFIPESNIVDILDAHLQKRKAPSFKSVLEHRCFTSHHFYDGINPYASEDPELIDRCHEALKEYRSSSYVDVHCWQFTPQGFRDTFGQLMRLGLLPECKEFKVYSGGAEFYVALSY